MAALVLASLAKAFSRRLPSLRSDGRWRWVGRTVCGPAGQMGWGRQELSQVWLLWCAQGLGKCRDPLAALGLTQDPKPLYFQLCSPGQDGCV